MFFLSKKILQKTNKKFIAVLNYWFLNIYCERNRQKTIKNQTQNVGEYNKLVSGQAKQGKRCLIT
jgi:hypothetical protein